MPAVGSSKPPIMRSVVVLPQPDGPSSATKPPRSKESERSSTALMSPKALGHAIEPNVWLIHSNSSKIVLHGAGQRISLKSALSTSKFEAGRSHIGMKLDTVNRRIVESLQRDGRRAFTDIARELGISETAVRARVHRLTEEGVIEIVAVTNPLMVGFDVMAMIGVRADGHLQRIADEVGAWDESSYVVILSGSLDLLVEVVCCRQPPPAGR